MIGHCPSTGILRYFYENKNGQTAYAERAGKRRFNWSKIRAK
jgi:hypothetical protein